MHRSRMVRRKELPRLKGRGLESYDTPDEACSRRARQPAEPWPTRSDMVGPEASRIADANGLVYTSYSDDLTFSRSSEFSRLTGSSLVGQVERAITFAGFQVHKKKTRLVPPGARKIVLGLMVTEDDVRLVPEFRNRLDNHIRCVNKYGPAAHAATSRFDSALSMINFVDGCFAFAMDIERDWAHDELCGGMMRFVSMGIPWQGMFSRMACRESYNPSTRYD